MQEYYKVLGVSENATNEEIETAYKTLKEKPDFNTLGFGKYVTDYMFVMDYDAENGWHNAQIVPYDDFMMDPRCVTLHYGLETFEGMKAYRRADGQIQLFRPDMNAKRMQKSNERLCLAEVPGKCG